MNCKKCGNEVETKAKTCSCGAKLSKPIYKRAWFIILIAIIVIGIVGSALGDDEADVYDAIASETDLNGYTERLIDTLYVEISVEPIIHEIGVVSFEISTNLPDNTELELNLSKASYRGDGTYFTVDGTIYAPAGWAIRRQVTVLNGMATSEIFSMETVENFASVEDFEREKERLNPVTGTQVLHLLVSSIPAEYVGEYGEALKGEWVNPPSTTETGRKLSATVSAWFNIYLPE